jgi:hypothetical protein
MSYTSGNKAPTLMAQMPNRVGNVSKHTPSNSGGATAVTGTKHGVALPKGSQGAAKATGSITGIHQKVTVSRPQESYGSNCGYMDKSVKNYKG